MRWRLGIDLGTNSEGEIYILIFTDRQYENIVRFSGQRRKRPKKEPDQLALF